MTKLDPTKFPAVIEELNRSVPRGHSFEFTLYLSSLRRLPLSCFSAAALITVSALPASAASLRCQPPQSCFFPIIPSL